MSAILEQIAPPETFKSTLAFDDEYEGLFTVAALEDLPENANFRFELIKGEIIVSTAPRYIHQLTVSKLNTEIAIYLKQNPIGEVTPAPGLIFSDFDAAIPDLIYLSHERREQILQPSDGKLHGAPEIAVEVLSPGRLNRRRDTVQKRELYEEFGVAEYWIVDPRGATVQIYRRSDNKLQLAQTCGENDSITTPLLPGFACAVKNLF